MPIKAISLNPDFQVVMQKVERILPTFSGKFL
jgi:hypothetical protein